MRKFALSARVFSGFSQGAQTPYAGDGEPPPSEAVIREGALKTLQDTVTGLNLDNCGCGILSKLPVDPSQMAMARSLRSTGITPLRHYCGAVRP
jgi:hypothetical protein